MSEYDSLVTAAKSLTQGTAPNTHTLPVAENEWDTRPDTVSYGIISHDFEADALRADNLKTVRSAEGSMDLYSMEKGGAGWVPMIEKMLTDHCGGAWVLNTHTYERSTGLFHWEWVFQTEE